MQIAGLDLTGGYGSRMESIDKGLASLSGQPMMYVITRLHKIA